LVTVERSRVTRLAEAGDRRAQKVLRSLRRLSFELSGAQLGITVVSLVLGAIAEPTVARLFEPVLARLGLSTATSLALAVAIALGLATAAQMVVGELVPKNYATAHPYRTAVLAGIPLQWLNRLARPLITALNRAANLAVRLLGVEPREELAGIRTLEELELVIRASGATGELDQHELGLLTRSLDFAEKIATDAMIPRVSVVGIEQGEPLPSLKRLSAETGHSRFPVYEEDLDRITGVVHVKDILTVEPQHRPLTPVSSITKPALVIPESKPLDGVLLELQRSGRSLAVVADEYGGTAGIITMEDLLEEIFGEITDEYDRIVAEPTPAGTGQVILSGLSNRYEVEEGCGFEWPEGHYETLGGFLTARLGRFPTPGDSLQIDGYTFTIERMDGYRVDRVAVQPPEVSR
jgi:CBS domain containing-hemolysin-like protein